MDDDGDEQLGMPEVMEATSRTPPRARDIPDDLVEEYGRNALSTPYNSEMREEDEYIEVYEQEHELQEEVHEPETEVEVEPPPYVSEPVIPVSVPAVEVLEVRQSGRVRSKPDRYGFSHKVLHITKRGSSAVWGQCSQ